MSYRIITLLLSAVFLLSACNITFKRKSAPKKDEARVLVKTKDGKKMFIGFPVKDIAAIRLYFKDKAHAQILSDMQSYMKLTKKQKKQLKKNNILSSDIQVMPLPLELERKLVKLPVSQLRVMVGNYVLLLQVKSRRILELIEL